MKIICAFVFIAIFVFVVYPVLFEKDDLVEVLNNSLRKESMNPQEGYLYTVNSKTHTILITKKGVAK